MKFCFELDDSYRPYIQSCARMRGISLHSLLRRIVLHVVREGLVTAVLDDEAKPGKLPGESRYHGPADPYESIIPRRPK